MNNTTHNHNVLNTVEDLMFNRTFNLKEDYLPQPQPGNPFTPTILTAGTTVKGKVKKGWIKGIVGDSVMVEGLMTDVGFIPMNLLNHDSHNMRKSGSAGNGKGKNKRHNLAKEDEGTAKLLVFAKDYTTQSGKTIKAGDSIVGHVVACGTDSAPKLCFAIDSPATPASTSAITPMVGGATPPSNATGINRGSNIGTHHTRGGGTSGGQSSGDLTGRRTAKVLRQDNLLLYPNGNGLALPITYKLGRTVSGIYGTYRNPFGEGMIVDDPINPNIFYPASSLQLLSIHNIRSQATGGCGCGCSGATGDAEIIDISANPALLESFTDIEVSAPTTGGTNAGANGSTTPITPLSVVSKGVSTTEDFVSAHGKKLGFGLLVAAIVIGYFVLHPKEAAALPIPVPTA